MGTSVSLRLPEDLQDRLENLSRRTGRSKTYYMIQAITERIDDLEAIYIAEQRLIDHRAGRSESFPQEEMEQRYGLAD